ncbi:MAG: hypothetical protein ACKOED_16125 [Aestuariivirga sp.]|uniref:hypothetical protein n=1 Tax=Aestuariivirga sp. TaxID=2650926 RepID=UPI0038CFDA77
MSSYHSARERYAVSRARAIAATTAALVPAFGVAFRLTGWSRTVQAAYRAQWHSPEFDWEEIYRRFGDPDRLDLAIWAGERLCGLGLATTTPAALNLLFLEGDSRPDCPLRGLRIPIFLDVAANYAQDRGKTELRVWPLTDNLAELYRDAYGFSLVTTGPGGPYWVRRIR